MNKQDTEQELRLALEKASQLWVEWGAARAGEDRAWSKSNVCRVAYDSQLVRVTRLTEQLIKDKDK